MKIAITMIKLRIKSLLEKKKVLFEKQPILKYLYYFLLVLFGVGIIVLIYKLMSISTLSMLITITVLYIFVYAWYTWNTFNNLGYYSSRKVENLRTGVVFGGFILLIAMLYMIYSLL